MLVSSVIVRVSIHDAQIAIDCATLAVTEALGVATAADAPGTFSLHHNVRLTRTGLSMPLIHDSGVANDVEPHAALLRLLIQACTWWAELREGELDVTGLASREGTTSSNVSRLVRLAFLAPDLVQAILTGKQPVGISVHALKREAIIAPDWPDQRRGFGCRRK